MFSDDNKKMATAIVAKITPKSGDDEEEVPERDTPEGLIAAAEDIMDVMSGYGPSVPSENASKVEKATAEAGRRAKAKILADALCAFLDQYE